LTDNKAILAMAMASVIEAIKSNNDKSYLQQEQRRHVSAYGYNYDPLWFNKNNDTVSTITPFTIQESNYLFPIEKLQKLAEGFYDKLSRMCVNNTMNTAIQNNY
jgi:hypothetical protein